jgi:uncharacterized protein YcbX
LKFDQKYTEIFEAKDLYRGWKESEEANQWFSEIFEMKVCLIRAEKDRFLTLNRWKMPKSHHSNRRGAFITEGAIHLINIKSMENLTEKLRSKYENDSEILENICVDARTFRPNFLIDHGFAHSEDDYQEFRVGNVMFR